MKVPTIEQVIEHVKSSECHPVTALDYARVAYYITVKLTQDMNKKHDDNLNCEVKT